MPVGLSMVMPFPVAEVTTLCEDDSNCGGGRAPAAARSVCPANSRATISSNANDPANEASPRRAINPPLPRGWPPGPSNLGLVVAKRGLLRESPRKLPRKLLDVGITNPVRIY